MGILALSITLIAVYKDFMAILSGFTSFVIIICTLNIKPITFICINAMSATNLALSIYYIVYNVLYILFSENFKLILFLLQLILSGLALVQFLENCLISYIYKLTQRIIFPNAPDVNHPIPLLSESKTNCQDQYILYANFVGVKTTANFDNYDVSESIELGERDKRKRIRKTPESLGEEAISS
eukprot:EST45986.1 Transmembrane domain-containing protein [Spironucleus salmonicida]